jgi:hypothetical protein
MVFADLSLPRQSTKVHREGDAILGIAVAFALFGLAIPGMAGQFFYRIDLALALSILVVFYPVTLKVRKVAD